jgi:hypothetical protein
MLALILSFTSGRTRMADYFIWIWLAGAIILALGINLGTRMVSEDKEQMSFAGASIACALWPATFALLIGYLAYKRVRSR